MKEKCNIQTDRQTKKLTDTNRHTDIQTYRHTDTQGDKLKMCESVLAISMDHWPPVGLGPVPPAPLVPPTDTHKYVIFYIFKKNLIFNLISPLLLHEPKTRHQVEEGRGVGPPPQWKDS